MSAIIQSYLVLTRCCEEPRTLLCRRPRRRLPSRDCRRESCSARRLLAGGSALQSHAHRHSVSTQPGHCYTAARWTCMYQAKLSSTGLCWLCWRVCMLDSGGWQASGPALCMPTSKGYVGRATGCGNLQMAFTQGTWFFSSYISSRVGCELIRPWLSRPWLQRCRRLDIISTSCMSR